MITDDMLFDFDENQDPNCLATEKPITNDEFTSHDSFNKTVELVCYWIQQNPLFTMNEIHKSLSIDICIVSQIINVLIWMGFVTKCSTPTKRKALEWIKKEPTKNPINIAEALKSHCIDLIL